MGFGSHCFYKCVNPKFPQASDSEDQTQPLSPQGEATLPGKVCSHEKFLECSKDIDSSAALLESLMAKLP